MKFIVVLLALVFVTACEQVTPPECERLCKQIEQWSVTCNGPALSMDTCIRLHSVQSNNASSQRVMGAHCWDALVAWTPNLKAELDCSKPPPRISMEKEK